MIVTVVAKVRYMVGVDMGMARGMVGDRVGVGIHNIQGVTCGGYGWAAGGGKVRDGPGGAWERLWLWWICQGGGWDWVLWSGSWLGQGW